MTELRELLEKELRPLTMQDIRLAAGEGRLLPQEILMAVNAILARRAEVVLALAQQSPTQQET